MPRLRAAACSGGGGCAGQGAAAGRSGKPGDASGGAVLSGQVLARAVQCSAAGRRWSTARWWQPRGVMRCLLHRPAADSRHLRVSSCPTAASSCRGAGCGDCQLRAAAALRAAAQVWRVSRQRHACSTQAVGALCRDNEPEVRTAATSKLSAFARLIPVSDVTAQVTKLPAM